MVQAFSHVPLSQVTMFQMFMRLVHNPFAGSIDSDPKCNQKEDFVHNNTQAYGRACQKSDRSWLYPSVFDRFHLVSFRLFQFIARAHFR
jgi:hypothetical protein